MFTKILIANRGEVTYRAIRTCREMGIKSVAVYSEADAESLFAKIADEAYPLGGSEPSASYLNIWKILEIARRSGVDAIYPGYGFLAENPDFVEACETNGFVFIGPPSKCMNKGKPKHKARQLMQRIGIAVVPGSEEAIENPDTDGPKAVEIAESIGYPVIVKPTSSGGGIGMAMARNREQLLKAISYARARGGYSFGSESFYIEKYLPKVRHIEFQVLADQEGNIVHLGERECSVQRSYQKLIEEAPSPAMTPEMRERMGNVAIEVAKALDYINAMTVEFIYEVDTKKFYFNEVNCRLQVEHPLTELTTGIDLVREQIRIAAGERLGYTQKDVQVRGWAIECRINAQDPLKGFMPSPYQITKYVLPVGSGIRIDDGVYAGYTVPFYYDPLVAKLLSWGENRNEAIQRMEKALRECSIEGIETTVSLCQMILEDKAFRAGDYTTSFLNESRVVEGLRQKMSLKPSPAS